MKPSISLVLVFTTFAASTRADDLDRYAGKLLSDEPNPFARLNSFEDPSMYRDENSIEEGKKAVAQAFRKISLKVHPDLHGGDPRYTQAMIRLKETQEEIVGWLDAYKDLISCGNQVKGCLQAYNKAAELSRTPEQIVRIHDPQLFPLESRDFIADKFEETTLRNKFFDLKPNLSQMIKATYAANPVNTAGRALIRDTLVQIKDKSDLYTYLGSVAKKPEVLREVLQNEGLMNICARLDKNLAEDGANGIKFRLLDKLIGTASMPEDMFHFMKMAKEMSPSVKAQAARMDRHLKHFFELNPSPQYQWAMLSEAPTADLDLRIREQSLPRAKTVDEFISTLTKNSKAPTEDVAYAESLGKLARKNMPTFLKLDPQAKSIGRLAQALTRDPYSAAVVYKTALTYAHTPREFLDILAAEPHPKDPQVWRAVGEAVAEHSPTFFQSHPSEAEVTELKNLANKAFGLNLTKDENGRRLLKSNQIISALSCLSMRARALLEP